MPFDGNEIAFAQSKPAVTFKDVTDRLCDGILAEAERLYANGANALVNAEIALVRQALYHKPNFNPDWSWDKKAAARTRGQTEPADRFDFDDVVDLRSSHDPDLYAEPEDIEKWKSERLALNKLIDNVNGRHPRLSHGK